MLWRWKPFWYKTEPAPKDYYITSNMGQIGEATPVRIPSDTQQASRLPKREWRCSWTPGYLSTSVSCRNGVERHCMLTSDTAVALEPSDAALNGSLQKGLLGLIDIASLDSMSVAISTDLDYMESLPWSHGSKRSFGSAHSCLAQPCRLQDTHPPPYKSYRPSSGPRPAVRPPYRGK